MDYLNYDVVTKTRVHHELPTLFPTVTVCNINPFVTQNASEFIRNIMVKELDLDVLNSTPSSGLLKYIEYAHVLALAERFKPEFEEISRKSFGFLLEDILFRCEFDENDCLNKESFSKIFTRQVCVNTVFKNPCLGDIKFEYFNVYVRIFNRDFHAEHDDMLRFDVAQSMKEGNGRKEKKGGKIKTWNFKNFNIDSY